MHAEKDINAEKDMHAERIFMQRKKKTNMHDRGHVWQEEDMHCREG